MSELKSKKARQFRRKACEENAEKVEETRPQNETSSGNPELPKSSQEEMYNKQEQIKSDAMEDDEIFQSKAMLLKSKKKPTSSLFSVDGTVANVTKSQTTLNSSNNISASNGVIGSKSASRSLLSFEGEEDSPVILSKVQTKGERKLLIKENLSNGSYASSGSNSSSGVGGNVEDVQYNSGKSTVPFSSPTPATSFSSASYGVYTPEAMQRLRKNCVYISKGVGHSSSPTEAGESLLVSERKSIKMESSQEKKEKEFLEQEEKIVASIDGNGKILNAEEMEQLELEEEEEDEEVKRWEAEQIKKGFGWPIPGEASDKHLISSALSISETKKTSKKKSNLFQNVNSLSVEEVQKKLMETIEATEAAYQRYQKQTQTVQEEIKSLEEIQQKTQKEHESLGKQYIFYRKMKDYTQDLSDCLAEKAALIEDCEDELIALDTAYAESLQKHNDLTECLWKQGWFEEKEKRSKQEDDKNDINYSQEVTRYREAREAILQRASSIFNDTETDYSSVHAIKEKFENWKFLYAETYKQSYCSLSVPLLFAPFVRLELLKWNPFLGDVLAEQHFPLRTLELPEDVIPLDEMTWYNELMFYGVDQNGSNGGDDIINGVSLEPSENDEDNNLVPVLLEKIILPKCVRLITNVWNPRAFYQTCILIRLIKQLHIYLEERSTTMKELYSAIHVSIQGVIETFPLLKTEDDLRHLIRLLKNISICHEFLSEDVLKRIIVDSSLNLKIIPFLSQIKSPEKTVLILEEIYEILPKTWFQSSNFPEKLSLFSNFVTRFLKKLDPQKDSNIFEKTKNILSLLHYR